MNEFSTKSPHLDGADGHVSHFRDVTIDFRRQTLVRGGLEIRLRGKSFDVLAYLVRHAGRVVDKRELIDAVWAGVAVSDDSLVQCLVEIRRNLGSAQDVVKTVRGRGYMLDADLAAAAPAARAADVAPVDLSTRRSRWLAVAALLSAVLIPAGLWWWNVAGVGPGAVKTGAVTREATLNIAASDAFAEGNRLLGNRSQVSLQTARRAFERSIELDPNFAPAHAALANTLCVLSAFGIEAPEQVLPAARAAARRSVELEPTHAFGWHALAHTQTLWDWDWEAAEANYRRAIALDPMALHPRMLLAHLLVGLGRADEAFAELDRALAIEPDSALVLGSVGIVNYLARRPDQALAAFAQALNQSPGYALPRFWQGLTFSFMGRHADAMTAALNAREDMGNPPAWLVGYVHARAGRQAEAQEVLRALEARAQQQYVSPIDIAVVQAALGNHEVALDWLERTLEQHGNGMVLLAVMPTLDPLRGHPRFTAVLRALRLPILP